MEYSAMRLNEVATLLVTAKSFSEKTRPFVEMMNMEIYMATHLSIGHGETLDLSDEWNNY